MTRSKLRAQLMKLVLTVSISKMHLSPTYFLYSMYSFTMTSTHIFNVHDTHTHAHTILSLHVF